MDHPTVVVRPCSRCGRPLPADAAEGLCASCLFEVGLETLTRESQDEAQTIGPSAANAAALDQQLSPGQTWGGYRIGRLLGRGGMFLSKIWMRLFERSATNSRPCES